MRILQKYLDVLAQASMKNRPLGQKIIAIILGGSTFLIIIPFLLFLAGYALERFVPASEWRLLQIAFSFAAICFGLLIVAMVDPDAGAHRRRDPGSGCSDSKADRVRSVQTVQKPAPAWGHALLSGNRDVFRLRQDRNGDAASQFHIGNLLSQICGGKGTAAAVRPRIRGIQGEDSIPAAENVTACKLMGS